MLQWGAAFVSQANYDSGVSLDTSFAYSESDWQYRVGALYLDEISPENSAHNTEVETRAGYLMVAKVLNFDSLKLELGGGLVFSQSEAFFRGRQVADESDTSPMLTVVAVRELTRVFALHADWKYINDINGGDIHLLQAGVRFSF